MTGPFGSIWSWPSITPVDRAPQSLTPWLGVKKKITIKNQINKLKTHLVFAGSRSHDLPMDGCVHAFVFVSLGDTQANGHVNHLKERKGLRGREVEKEYC